MERLEQILRAEDRARAALSAARQQAREIRAEAAVEVELIGQSAHRKALEQAAELRAGILRDADAEAAVVERDAEGELAGVVREAEKRLDDAVDTILAELTE